MKKVLKGKVYCTETEKEVARIENGCIFYHSVKILFRKKQGNISFNMNRIAPVISTWVCLQENLASN
jgi:hypothetical protein